MRTPPLPSPLKVDAPPSLSALESWLAETRLLVADPRLQAQWDAEAGWYIVARAEIPRATCLLSIEKTSLFSLRTAPFSRLVSPRLDTAAQAILHLSACLLHELRRGRESAWWAHWQILPRYGVLLPPFWANRDQGGDDGQAGLAWLRGTEAGKLLQGKEEDGLGLHDVKRYYLSTLPSFPPTADHPDPPSLPDFLYAFSMVSTRGFLIDSYHIIALIPFADLFNHSSSSPHTSVATDADVCPSCGSFGACAHVEEGPALSERQEALDRDAAAGKVVEMWAERAVGRGEEVWSCYEPKMGWGKMLVEWGFVPPPSSDTGSEDDAEAVGPGVTWRPREVLAKGTVRPFMALTEGTELWDALAKERRDVAAPDEQAGAPERIGQPTAEGRLLNVSPYGKVSLNLVVAAVLDEMNQSGRLGDPDDLEEPGLEVLDVCLQLEGRHQVTDAGKAVAGHLLGLVQEKLDGMTRPELSAGDLGQVLQNIGEGRELERMAVRVALQERRSLETARDSLRMPAGVPF